MTQKKKILHIIQSLGNGGCENMLLRTLPLLREFDHRIITLKEFGELAPKFVASGTTVETVHCDGFFDIAGILRLQKLVREENPDIIITYLFHADMLGRLALKTTAPIIPFLRTTYNHPKYFIARMLEWFTKTLVHHYLANSEAVKDFYVKYIGVAPEKITVIPNGIDTAYFDSIKPDFELRKSLGLAPEDFVIICVANLHVNKGHRYLLEAFEAISPRAQATKLLLVGDGEEKENLKQQIKNYRSKNNIFLLGRRTDVLQLLKISDCFVLPTLFEGQSNAILEAMAAGVPVVTTDIPENKILIQDKQTGYLTPAHSSKGIEASILEIIKGKARAQEVGLTARAFASKDFSLQKSTESLKTFLETI